MRCPVCKVPPLREVEAGDKKAKLDICRTCEGVWFDAKELEIVSGVAIKQLEAPLSAKRSKRACPRCQDPLRTFHYPQTMVEIDFCASCHGLWLDRGELKEIHTIRQHLKKRGEMQEVADPGGLKGALLNAVDSAIGVLSRFVAPPE